MHRSLTESGIVTFLPSVAPEAKLANPIYETALNTDLASPDSGVEKDRRPESAAIERRAAPQPPRSSAELARQNTASRAPLGRTLLFSIGLLFEVAVVVTSIGMLIMLPSMDSRIEAVVMIVALLLIGVLILILFGGKLLNRSVLGPIRGLVHDVTRIAGGEYHHRVGDASSRELQDISDAVNALSARLIHDQELLAENVRSLEATNRELVAASNQVVRSARLASVGTLASGIAHEVGNPLSAIMGFADLARARLAREGMETELLQSIMDETRRIDRIVRSLLHYARPKDEQYLPLDPTEIVARVRDLLETQGRFDRVKTHWHQEEDIPPVKMDPHQLEQVLVNLLLNAVDAMEATPDPSLVVTVSAEPGQAAKLPARRQDDPPGINYSHRRRVSWRGGDMLVDQVLAAQEIVLITIADNGPGIAEDHVDQLFDPFFTTKEPGKGTGLGLAVCARLIEGMGGRIEGGNHTGGGACFTIQLPAVEVADDTGADDGPQSDSQSRIVQDTAGEA